MCWFSTEYAKQVEEAKTGQRLGIKQMNWHSNWVVRETELDAPRPCPVCLIDRTRVLFRFSESQQASLHLGTEAEAVFRMSKKTKRDVFEFSDGRQITLGDLPAGLIFDVLVVPGSGLRTALARPRNGAGRAAPGGREGERTIPGSIAGTFLIPIGFGCEADVAVVSFLAAKVRIGKAPTTVTAKARWSREGMARPTHHSARQDSEAATPISGRVCFP